VTGFVVLTSPRSGSGWLIDLLDSHPAIVAYPELFHTERWTAPDYGANDLPYFEASVDRGRRPRVVHQLAYLAKLYAPRPRVHAVGFKLTYVQAATNPALLPLLSLRRVHAVHLVRANLLAAAISWKVARESGVYHVRGGAPASRDPVLLDVAGLRAELEERELAIARIRRRLELLRLRTLEIAYEYLVGRNEDTLARILCFLGLEAQVDLLESRLVRSSSQTPLERLGNPDDVRAALAGTHFEWMLEDAA
jgi:LPS sulfotransferase NodH